MTQKLICTSCGNTCGAVSIDDGIGPYEYEGQRGIHHNFITVSDCCEAAILDEFGSTYELPALTEDDIAEKESVIFERMEEDKSWEDLS